MRIVSINIIITITICQYLLTVSINNWEKTALVYRFVTQKAN